MKRKMLVALLLVAVLTLGAVLPAFAATGSWKINTKVGTYLSKADKKVFDKAVKGMKGVTYTPVLKLAEKTVNGKNYAFLCTAKAVTKSPKYSWKVLLINASSSGEVELLKVNSFSYKNPKTRSTPYKTSSTGSWVYSKQGKTSKGLPSGAQAAFNKAVKNLDGMSLTALALLSTQVVSGTNYRFLCRGNTVTLGSVSCLYVVDVYKNAKGKCKISRCDVLNLPAYLM